MCCASNTGQAEQGPHAESAPAAPPRRTPAVFTTDHTGRITSWSAGAAALFGRAADEALGMKWDVLFDSDMSESLTEALADITRGETYNGALHVKSDSGALLHLALNCTPLIGDSGDPVLLCDIRDAAADSLAQTRAAFFDELMRKAPFGLVAVDENLRYVLAGEALAAMNGVPAASHLGRRVGEVVRAADGGAYEERLLEALRTGEPQHGLVVNARTDGHPHADRTWSVSLFRLNADDGRVLGLGGIVVDVTEKQTALLEVSAARERLALVNEATTRVGTTLEMPQIAEELAAVAVPAFSDMAVVKIRDDLFGDTVPDISDLPVRLRRLAGLSMNNRASQEIFRTHGEISQEPGTLLHEAMRTGQAMLLSKIDEEAVTALAQDAEHARLIRRSGLGSLIVAPFVARGRVLGVVLLGRSAKRAPMTVEDLRSAEELAARTATCLDNALAYSNERRIAVALQRSMLPEEEVIPQPSGLEIAHHYRPSSNAAQVGGDWFDVIPLSGHRVALAVGDVMGHDIHAAANMGQLRTAMRTLAQLDLEPVDLLTRLDEAVQKGTTMQYATCVYAVCNVVTRECSIVSAGHPPPLLRHADGTTEIVTVAPGVPLGVASDDPEFAVTELVLPEDSTLVLYTDGLVEHRGEDIDAGIETLRTVLGPGTGSTRDLCERVAARLSRPVAEDDLAVLMARVPTGLGHAFASWTLEPRPESVSRARALVRQTLDAWNLSALEDATTLLVSELVTNALRYGRGGIDLRLAKGGVFVCEVADGDVRVPRRRHPGPDEEGGRGLAVVSEYSRGWGTRPTASGKVVWFELALPEG